MPKILAKLQQGNTIVAPNTNGVGKNQLFFTDISLYLRNNVRQVHSYYERLIRTHVTLNDLVWPSRPFTYGKRFQMEFFAQLCSCWQDFDWYNTSCSLRSYRSLQLFKWPI